MNKKNHMAITCGKKIAEIVGYSRVVAHFSFCVT
jgi:hypothetical protein